MTVFNKDLEQRGIRGYKLEDILSEFKSTAISNAAHYRYCLPQLDPKIKSELMNLLYSEFDDKWLESGCQRYKTMGNDKFTFCGNSVSEGRFACNACMNKKSGVNTNDLFKDKYTPKEHRCKVRKERIEYACGELNKYI